MREVSGKQKGKGFGKTLAALNLRQLIGGYFFLPADFLLLVFDLFCLGFVSFLAMMFWCFLCSFPCGMSARRRGA